MTARDWKQRALDGGAGLVVLGLAAYTYVFFWNLLDASPYLAGVDGYYHTRFAQLLHVSGLPDGFPWTQLSLWRDSFSDKELLFHLYLSIFCRDETMLLVSGKQALVVLLTLLFTTFYFALKSLNVRAPLLWWFALLSCGVQFTWRLLLVRPHVLMLVFVVLAVVALAHRRWKLLIPLGMAYAWAHSAPHNLVGITIVYAGSVFLAERRLEWRPVVYATAGVLLGYIVHPYFPNTFVNWYVQNVKVGQFILGERPVHLQLGMEFNPFLTRDLLVHSFTPIVLWFASILATIALGVKLTRNGRFLVVLASAFAVLTMISGRFVEIFVPVAVLAAAVVLSELWDSEETAFSRLLDRGSTRTVVVVALSALLFVSHQRTHAGTHEMAVHTPRPTLENVSRWMRDNLPAGETVIHFEWDEFTELYHFDPDHHYLVGLDPTFGYFHDPEIWDYIGWLHLNHPDVTAWSVKERLDARYVVAGARCADTRHWWSHRPGVTEIYADHDYSVFELGDSTALADPAPGAAADTLLSTLAGSRDRSEDASQPGGWVRLGDSDRPAPRPSPPPSPPPPYVTP